MLLFTLDLALNPWENMWEWKNMDFLIMSTPDDINIPSVFHPGMLLLPSFNKTEEFTMLNTKASGL